MLALDDGIRPAVSDKVHSGVLPCLNTTPTLLVQRAWSPPSTKLAKCIVKYDREDSRTVSTCLLLQLIAAPKAEAQRVAKMEVCLRACSDD